MKATINLNDTRSITELKKKLLSIKKTLKEIQKDFLEDVANEIINLANKTVSLSDIGEDVKRDIMGGWYIDPTQNGFKVYNTSEKAVFVEFGVGYEGYIDKHPQATKEGYQYMVGEKINPNTHIWIFNVENDAEIDISETYIVRRGNTSVSTRGQPALLFAYNAIIDIQISGKLQELWDKNYERFTK